MGGGALMTPMLVLIFGVTPASAISSDLVAALFMKPFGVAIHWKRHTVNGGIVRALAYGSVPGALLGSYVLHLLGGSKTTQTHLQIILGLALLVGATAMVARIVFPAKVASATEVALRPLVTSFIGLVGGFMVGLTSVGAGSLILVLLTLIYPALRSDVLVGTDLAQSLPLTAAATLGAILFGKVSFGLTAAIIIGAVPAVIVGALISSKSFTVSLRPILAAVAFISGCKYVGVPVNALGVIAGVALTLASLLAWRVARSPQSVAALENVEE
jgi:uncharacterized membrane protein YfcA